MSTGPRITLAAAFAVAEVLMKSWGMAHNDCAIVGSVRRRRSLVGDLEFIAPHEPETDDRLHGRMAPTVTDTAGMLFGEAKPVRFGEVIRGFKPGFWAASLQVKISINEVEHVMNVQIFRYVKGEQGNRGWIELMRTGPQDLGILFLEQWKWAMGIRGGKGSDDGWLLDPYGKPVFTPDEESCFRLAKLDYIPPQERDAWVHTRMSQNARAHREATR